MSLVNLYIYGYYYVINFGHPNSCIYKHNFSKNVLHIKLKNHRGFDFFKKKISYEIIIQSTYLSANMISSVDFGIRVLADKNIQDIGDLIKEKKFPEVIVYLE